VAAPFGKEIGLSKTWMAAGITPLVVLATWAALRAVRKRLH
jgi:hypothetical protein